MEERSVQMMEMRREETVAKLTTALGGTLRRYVNA